MKIDVLVRTFKTEILEHYHELIYDKCSRSFFMKSNTGNVCLVTLKSLKKLCSKIESKE